MSEEQRIDAWSFNRLMDYETCDFMAWLKHGQKIPEPDTKDRTALDRGIKVHEDCEKYVKGETQELTDDTKVKKNIGKFKFDEYRALYAEDPSRFFLEEQWGFDSEWNETEYFGDSIWLRASIDRGYWLDEERTAVEVTDYKTGKKMGNEVKHAQQLQLYAVACFMRFPSLQTAKVCIEYLDEGKTVRRAYTREQVQFFLANFDKRGKKMTTATTFPPRPNMMNCMWCPYSPNNGGSGYCQYGVEI